MLFITDTCATWETSREWQDMAWLQAVDLTRAIDLPTMGEDALPALRDVDLMLMGQ
jgi:hypothetical protein